MRAFGNHLAPSSAPSSGTFFGSNNAAPTVATNGATTQANEALIASFGFLAATGGFACAAPFNPLSGVCDFPHCMFPGYYLLGATGSYSATPTTGDLTNWAGLLVTLKGDNTIFSNRIANSTTSNGSATVP